MTVRIVSDYWKNYEEYKDVISRCFFHISKKFRIDDSYEAIYNTVLVELHRQEIFIKFDPSRVDTSKISVEKKFEQYLFMWINQILSNLYRSRGKQKSMFVNYGDMNNYHPETYKANRKVGLNNDGNVDENWDMMHNAPSIEPSISSVDKKYPWYEQTSGFYVAEQENAEDIVFFKEIMELVRSKISEDKRVIFDLFIKNYEPKDIAKLLGYTPEIIYRAVRECKEHAQKVMSK